MKKNKISDLRRYASQTNARLIIGGLLLLVFIGLGLVLFFYGKGAAATGLLCVFAGLVPVLLIYLILGLFNWIVKRNRDQ